ncbi:MAG: hypothetical protein NTV01_08550, partial [Bacteroidia bacterium]|nr:hypothetical protein [Bacteroidia bacterium]
GWDVKKNDLTECATINDLMLGRGQMIPEKPPLNRFRAQSGVFLQARYAGNKISNQKKGMKWELMFKALSVAGKESNMKQE